MTAQDPDPAHASHPTPQSSHRETYEPTLRQLITPYTKLLKYIKKAKNQK
jgi:hypothetical protein